MQKSNIEAAERTTLLLSGKATEIAALVAQQDLLVSSQSELQTVNSTLEKSLQAKRLKCTRLTEELNTTKTSTEEMMNALKKEKSDMATVLSVFPSSHLMMEKIRALVSSHVQVERPPQLAKPIPSQLPLPQPLRSGPSQLATVSDPSGSVSMYQLDPRPGSRHAGLTLVQVSWNSTIQIVRDFTPDPSYTASIHEALGQIASILEKHSARINFNAWQLAWKTTKKEWSCLKGVANRTTRRFSEEISCPSCEREGNNVCIQVKLIANQVFFKMIDTARAQKRRR